MAVTAATKQSDFSGFLKAEQAAPIFERAARTSVVQRLANQVPMGATGQDIPVVSGKLQASWVAEAGQKPVSQGAMTLKTMTPKKIAVIAVVSQEVVRTNPGGYMQQLTKQMGEAFAIAFDAACLHGTSTPFGQYLDQTTKAVALGTSNAASGGVYSDLNNGLGLLVAGNKRLTGFAFDNRMEPILNGAVDTTGRPLFIDATYDQAAISGDPANLRVGSVMGRPAYMGEGVGADTPGSAGVTYPLGYGGDWTQVAWGQIGGIKYDLSRETAVTINGVLTSMFEYNLVAVRAEAEFGFICNDTGSFVKYTKTTV